MFNFYFDLIHPTTHEFPSSMEILKSEDLGADSKRSRISLIIINDEDATKITRNFWGIPLNMTQIKEACSVNDVDEMKKIPPSYRDKIFQTAIQDDWQFE